MANYKINGKKIEYLDNRFYQNGEEYYPSVTTVLGVVPTDPQILAWYKNNGNNTDYIIRKAGEDGTAVHEALEKLSMGEEVNHQDFSDTQWEMINKGFEFLNGYRFTDTEEEQNLVSKTYKLGGTLDKQGILDSVPPKFAKELEKYVGKRFIVDYKTSNFIQHKHKLQLVAYGKMLEDVKGIKTDFYGILHLKSKVRTHKGFQNRGWKLEVLDSKKIEEYWEEYQQHQKTFAMTVGKTIKPRIKSFNRNLKLT